MNPTIVSHAQSLDQTVGVVVDATITAGDFLKHSSFNEQKTEKDDAYVGHHAIVTSADIASQKKILQMLGSVHRARFICEEKTKNPAVLTDENYIAHLDGLVLINDALDGTSSFNRKHYEWSVSTGIMDAMQHTAGVIYAPDVRDGLIVYGVRGKGVWFSEYGALPRKAQQITERVERKRSVLFGVDIAFMPEMNKYRELVSHNIQTSNVVGSCALGLAQVALGRADALVQPVQSVWDWAGGVPLVLENGGKVQFYKFIDGKPVFVTPQEEDYTPAHRRLGFIAGAPQCVDDLTAALYQHFH